MLSAQYFRENIQIILLLMIIYISLLKSYHGPVTIKMQYNQSQFNRVNRLTIQLVINETKMLTYC